MGTWSEEPDDNDTVLDLWGDFGDVLMSHVREIEDPWNALGVVKLMIESGFDVPETFRVSLAERIKNIDFDAQGWNDVGRVKAVRDAYVERLETGVIDEKAHPVIPTGLSLRPKNHIFHIIQNLIEAPSRYEEQHLRDIESVLDAITTKENVDKLTASRKKHDKNRTKFKCKCGVWGVRELTYADVPCPECGTLPNNPV